MYTDYCLKFTDEAAAKAVLYTEVPTAWDNTDPENPVVTETYDKPNYRNIDTIGIIYERTGGTDEEPVMTALDGWHVNVRSVDGEDTSALDAFVVTPLTPIRVWA
jgi:hypothetical protein